MSNYVTLMGAEDVRSAGNRMASAADEMQRAAANMAHAFEQHQRFLDDWLERLNGTLSDRISDLGVTMGPQL